MSDDARPVDEVEALRLCLKVHMYAEFGKLAATWTPQARTLPPAFGRFTSRKVRRLVCSESANPEAMVDQVSEFYGATSNYFADRLEDLARRGTLVYEGTGLRGVRVYRWSAPLARGSLVVFQRLRAAYGGKVAFAFDLHRIQETFALGPFALSDFVTMHSGLRRDRAGTRYGILRDASLLRSSRYAHFLRSRLAGLFALGFLVEEEGRYRISERGLEALLRFDVFARGTELSAEREAPSVDSDHVE